MKKSSSDKDKKKEKKSSSSSSSFDITSFFVKNWKIVIQVLVAVLGIVFASTLFQVNRYNILLIILINILIIYDKL